jgi:hypothetical protein
MRVSSSVATVELIAPGAEEFNRALESLLGREPDEVLKPALPYSAIARNNDSRTVALLGVRFDMLGPKAKPYSVVHYADALRHPEKADLTPGAMRFVCAEPLYTDLVLRRAREVDLRGRMNLDNLRTALRIEASLDCAAFADGQFAGPDSLGAFDRFERERKMENAFLKEVLQPDCDLEAVLPQMVEVPLATRTLARRLYAAFETGRPDEAVLQARNHRVRIKLWREAPPV